MLQQICNYKETSAYQLQDQFSPKTHQVVFIVCKSLWFLLFTLLQTKWKHVPWGSTQGRIAKSPNRISAFGQPVISYQEVHPCKTLPEDRRRVTISVYPQCLCSSIYFILFYFYKHKFYIMSGLLLVYLSETFDCQSGQRNFYFCQ